MMRFNKYVKQWQEELIRHGRGVGNAGADGKFGEMTMDASLALLDDTIIDDKTEKASAQTIKKAICTANSYVNVRDGRGGSYKEYEDIGNVYAGEVVEVYDDDIDREYIEIAWNGGRGYAYCKNGAYFRYCDEKAALSNEKASAMLAAVREIATPKDGVSAKYIYGGEGTKITRSYVEARYARYPGYFSGGRKQMLLSIADECEKNGEWIYPIHYAWDCSGLWWYGANKAKLYGEREVDASAAGTYANYCIPIEKSELRPGDLVFYYSGGRGRITHMGIAGENGVVYEAMSGYVGVVVGDSVDDRTAMYLPGTDKQGQKYTSGVWNRFGRPKVFA